MKYLIYLYLIILSIGILGSFNTYCFEQSMYCYVNIYTFIPYSFLVVINIILSLTALIEVLSKNLPSKRLLLSIALSSLLIVIFPMILNRVINTSPESNYQYIEYNLLSFSNFVVSAIPTILYLRKEKQSKDLL